MRLDTSGPGSVMSSMLLGSAFESVCDVEIAHIADGGVLRCTVVFDSQPASKHARYSPCAGVGMSILGDGWCDIRFTSNDARTPKALMKDALRHTDERIQRALFALANQPDTPPCSYA